MRLLAVDIGTGTQDVLLFDTDVQVENCFKIVAPSPTMQVARRIKAATRRGEAVVLTGVMMGGGPSGWAAEEHIRQGYRLYATPEAARTFNDDLSRVEAMGVRIIGEEEAARLTGATPITLRDFGFTALSEAFERLGVTLGVDAVAVAVFDHGNAPPDVSDRQFRFDYLDARLRAANRLSTFAFRAEETPAIMTRMLAVVASAALPEGIPLMVMDTAPAAVMGALLDPVVAQHERLLVANVGNFHTLAFRLESGRIEGIFEHHTGLIDGAKLDGLLSRLADSTLRREEVFGDQGHGALVYNSAPMPLDFVAVTGPRRALMRESVHRPTFAVPYGDMMLAGCYGLVRAFADLHPEHHEAIGESLAGAPRGAPWELL
jgi:uncharacterized protein (DUF1786 family)